MKRAVLGGGVLAVILAGFITYIFASTVPINQVTINMGTGFTSQRDADWRDIVRGEVVGLIPTNSEDRGIHLSNRAQLASDLGHHARAQRLFAKTFEESGDPIVLYDAYLRAFRSGDNPLALNAASQLYTYADSESVRIEAAANLVTHQLLDGDGAAAGVLLTELAATFDDPDSIIFNMLLTRQALVSLLAGQYETAETLSRDACLAWEDKLESSSGQDDYLASVLSEPQHVQCGSGFNCEVFLFQSLLVQAAALTQMGDPASSTDVMQRALEHARNVYTPDGFPAVQMPVDPLLMALETQLTVGFETGTDLRVWIQNIECPSIPHEDFLTICVAQPFMTRAPTP
ncbi:MAG: hypothetical protein P8P99_15245 [Maricaulis sp.]|nr:hypothetical protein [Maricaulis sp.]